MKKIKMILSAFAIIVAIGATFASQYDTPTTITGWEFVEQDDECVSHSGLDCHIADTGIPCTIANDIPMRQENNATTGCGAVLRKNTP